MPGKSLIDTALVQGIFKKVAGGYAHLDSKAVTVGAHW
jgi:hypothetical protein